jgi:hypothetical protein
VTHSFVPFIHSRTISISHVDTASRRIPSTFCCEQAHTRYNNDNISILKSRGTAKQRAKEDREGGSETERKQSSAAVPIRGCSQLTQLNETTATDYAHTNNVPNNNAT